MADSRTIELRAMAAQIRSWLQWHGNRRASESLTTDGGTAIMALPVAYWPTRGMFEKWIEALEGGAEEIADLTNQLESALAPREEYL